MATKIKKKPKEPHEQRYTYTKSGLSKLIAQHIADYIRENHYYSRETLAKCVQEMSRVSFDIAYRIIATVLMEQRLVPPDVLEEQVLPEVRIVYDAYMSDPVLTDLSPDEYIDRADQRMVYAAEHWEKPEYNPMGNICVKSEDLTTKQKLTMFDWSGYRLGEIAGILGMKPKSVSTALTRLAAEGTHVQRGGYCDELS